MTLADGTGNRFRPARNTGNTAKVIHMTTATPHALCPPDAHDRDVTPGETDQATDTHGLRVCNFCGEPMFYCRVTQWYHHAGPACAGWPDQAAASHR